MRLNYSVLLLLLLSSAPLFAVGLSGYSDYRTPTSLVLQWSDPNTNSFGAPLHGYSIQLYRDGSLYALIDSGIGTYTDTGLTFRKPYSYKLRAISATDSSLFSNSVTVYAGGHPTPKAPTEFVITNVHNGVKLDWKNPTRRLDNTPFNNFYAVRISRDFFIYDSILVSPSDTGTYMQYTDTTTGYHYYQVYVYDNEFPVHRNWSLILLGYGGLAVPSYSQDFESGKGEIVVNGTWDTTHVIASSGVASFTDNKESNITGIIPTEFLLPPIRVTENHVLEFKEIGLLTEDNRGVITITPFNKPLATLGYTQVSDYAEWFDGQLTMDDWKTHRISLAQYAGDSVAIGFYLSLGAETASDGWFIDDIVVGNPLAIGDEPSGTLPLTTTLNQNYPNPFNPSTAIRYSLPTSSYVTLKVYSIMGQEIATLADGFQSAGNHVQKWNASGLPSGVYFYRLSTEQTTLTGKMLLLK